MSKCKDGLALKAAMTGAGLTQRDVADAIGVSLSRFNAKLNERGGACFDLHELRMMKKTMNLSAKDMDRIFYKED